MVSAVRNDLGRRLHAVNRLCATFRKSSNVCLFNFC